jgi:hypothetical protein
MAWLWGHWGSDRTGGSAAWLPRDGGWVGWRWPGPWMGMHSRTPPGRPRTAGPELVEGNERPPAATKMHLASTRAGLSSAAAPMHPITNPNFQVTTHDREVISEVIMTGTAISAMVNCQD